MNRIYKFPKPKPLLGAVASVGFGLLFSWAIFGGVYFVVPTVFFLGNWMRVWATHPAIQFGDDTFHIITPLFTRKVPYSQFLPYLSEVKSGQEGVRFYYQTSQKKSFLFSGTVEVQWRQRYFRVILKYRCGIKPEKDPAQRANAQSPEISPQEMSQLALAFPEETLANPALALFSLEDPKLYAEILSEAKRGIIEEWLVYATERQQRLFLCDSLQKLDGLGFALPASWVPVLESCRQFSMGTISQKTLEKIIKDTTENKDHFKEHTIRHKMTLTLGGAIKLLYFEPFRSFKIMLRCKEVDKDIYCALVAWQYEKIKGMGQ